MTIGSGTRLSQMSVRKLRWSSLVFVSMASLMVSRPVQAQQVRVIRAPAPYNACNLRTSAGVQHRVVGTFRNGTQVTLLGEAGRGWYRVRVGQQIGWLARQCLGL